MAIPRPRGIVWALTFACPLRCVHCYTESGRRSARPLDFADMLRIADAMIEMQVPEVAVAGGEPLTVPGVHELGRRIRAAGVQASIWTSGWNLRPEMVDELVRSFDVVHVSIDGPTAGVHDAIRGRRGSFERAMAALRLLDEESRRRRASGGSVIRFGIDCVVTRSNYELLDAYCTEIASQLPELGFLAFGAGLPIGLASRVGFVDHELLTDEQSAALVAPRTVDRLRALAPPAVDLYIDSNQAANPALNDQDPAITFMEVEADGGVRAFPIYEGVVGNLLDEPGSVLWEKALARRRDPFVREAFASVRTAADWAAAVRRIDHHFGTDEVRARLERRPEFVPLSLP